MLTLHLVLEGPVSARGDTGGEGLGVHRSWPTSLLLGALQGPAPESWWELLRGKGGSPSRSSKLGNMLSARSESFPLLCEHGISSVT